MSVVIHPTAFVEEGAILHPGVRIGPFCHVGANAELGEGTQLMSHSVVTGYTKLGANCILYPHAVLGSGPQVVGAREGPDSRLEVGPGCVFREHVTAHSGLPKSGGLTRLGSGCYLMAGSHVAHDCRIGDNVVMANNVALAGHIEVGDYVWFGGQAAVHQFTRIGRNAFIGGGAILVEDVIPFGSVVGNRAKLAGLNVVGLKRRGFSKSDLAAIRSAYRAIFEGGGLFQDRLASTAATHAGQPLAMELVDFIRQGGERPLCKPA
jgi:UDP-N-acetylglucosamine acyltransferase